MPWYVPRLSVPLQIVGAGDAAPAVALVTATISADSAAHAYSQETFIPIDLPSAR
jgi:hypothetical protein